MTDSRLTEIKEAVNIYGPANSWTGANGMLATMIRELIEEMENLKQKTNDQ